MCLSKRIAEDAQYCGRSVMHSIMVGFMKSWCIREGKVLVKACTISGWKNDERRLSAEMLAWAGRMGE